MGKTKTTKKKTSKTSGALGKIKSALGGKLKGAKSSGGRKRRSRGPTYWANKVLVEKLKKKYWKIKYGGR